MGFVISKNLPGASERNLSKQNNAIRLSIIILDIGAKMLREHILHELNENKINDLKALFNHSEVKSKCYGSKKIKGLKSFWHINLNQEIPDKLKCLDNLDISYCNALIQNVFKNKEQSIFKYSDTKSKYVEQLTDIRNKEFGHMLYFETDDLNFSTTVVRLEEIIRQLCDYDAKVSDHFIDRIEKELDKDSFQNIDKTRMFQMLTEQKELFEKTFNSLVLKLEKSNDQILKSFNERLAEFQKSIKNNSINIQLFEQLINDMKSTEKSRNILLEEINSKVSKIDENQDELNSKVSKICPKIDEKANEIVSLIHKLPVKIATSINENNNGM